VADANLEIHVGVSSRDLEILPLPCDYPFSLTNFTVNIKKKRFHKTQLYLAVTNKVKTIFAYQFPALQCF
jgi:hypothetical protein